MRNCPSCNSDLIATTLPHGGAIHTCRECGWGSDRLRDRKLQAGIDTAPDRSIPIRTILKLPIFWALSALVVFGPWIAIVYGIPALAEQQGWTYIEATPQSLAADLNPVYWYVMAAYLALASLVKGAIQFDNLGLFGTMIDNPFSFEDDWNRSMLTLGLLLLPGKLVVFTVAGTFKVFQKLLTGRVSHAS